MTMTLVSPLVYTVVLALWTLYILLGKHRIPNPDGSAYLDRWPLFRIPWGPRLFLHRIYTKDPDRPVHNHPWAWAKALILSGGYTEERTSDGSLYRMRTYGPGAVNGLGLADYHSILHVLPNTWTLFLTGPRVRDWGFLVGHTHVPWRQYLHLPEDYKLSD